jgi:hypothetical protein
MTVGNLTGLAELEIWVDCTFRHKSRIWWNFAMTTPETLNTKLAANELSFLLVTHAVYYDAQFDSYGILKSGRGAENFLDRLDIQMNDQLLQAQDAWNMVNDVYGYRRPLTRLSNTYSYAHFWQQQPWLRPLKYSHMQSLVDHRKMES